VDDLGEVPEARVVEAEALDQDLEGAAVPLVRVLGVEHVEAQLARPRAVVLGRDELEPRLGVDEPPDGPGAGHPVHASLGDGPGSRRHARDITTASLRFSL